MTAVFPAGLSSLFASLTASFLGFHDDVTAFISYRADPHVMTSFGVHSTDKGRPYLSI